MFNINSTLSRRNFLAGAAALGSTAALAGCSSGSSDGGSADDGKTFKIGVIGPLTGAAATYGVSAEKGAKLAAKDFSTKDLKLSLKSEDDVADGEKAINAFNTLCDWGMQALVGPVTFFGLLVSNMAYQLMHTHQHRYTLPATVLLGALLLVGGQMVLERVFSFNTSLSIVVEFLGGLTFIYLLVRKAKN